MKNNIQPPTFETIRQFLDRKLAIHLGLSALIAAVTAIAAVQIFAPDEEKIFRALVKEETVYERIIRTGVVRCGYSAWPPTLIKDPKTGEFSGIFFDYLDEMGKILNLKFEFTEEVTMTEYPDLIAKDKIDAMCSGVSATADQSKTIDFTRPIYYMPLYVFVRAEDVRFGKDFSSLNNTKYTMVTTEGSITASLRQKNFSQTKNIELPQFARPPELFDIVANKKADFVISSYYSFKEFDKAHPGTIRPLSMKPVKVYARGLGIKNNDVQLRRMLDTATEELIYSGEIERIMDKYEKYPHSYYRAAMPYRE